MSCSQIKKIFLLLIITTLIFSVRLWADSESSQPETTVTAPETSATETANPSSQTTSFKDRKDKEGYSLNLKDLIKESKKKIDKVNDKLKEQARQRRNQQREEKAREYYEKAMHLYDEGRLPEAQELWHKAIKITEHPEMKDYISESVKKSKKQEDLFRKEETLQLKEKEIERGYSAKEVEAAYQRAVELYKKNNYVAAKDEFEKVEDMFPDHKATRSYLMVLEQEIQKEQQKLIDEQMEGKVVSKRKEKEEWRRRIEEKERQQQMTLEEQAEAAYREAVKLYKDRKFEMAKDKFREVEWILPNYKSTVQYLSRVDRDIKEEEKRTALMLDQKKDQDMEENWSDQKRAAKLKNKERGIKNEQEISRMKDEADFVYETALSFYKKKEYQDARNKFQEVDGLYPNYKKTKQYLDKLNKILKTEEDDLSQKKLAAFEKELKEAKDAVYKEQLRQSKRGELKNSMESDKVQDEALLLYDAGVSLFKKELYKQAKDKFSEVDKIQPGYKLTSQYLSRIDSLLNIEPETAAKTKSKDESVDREDKLSSEEKSLQNAISERQQKMSVMAENKYQQAVKFYKEENFIEAKLKFIQVEALSSDYKDTGEYLSHIDDDIARMRTSKKFNQRIKLDESVKEKPADKNRKKTEAKIYEEMINVPEPASEESVKTKMKSIDQIKPAESKYTYTPDKNSLLVAQLKAKEEYAHELSKKKYEEFQKNIQDQRKAAEQAEKMRDIAEKKAQNDLMRQMREEENAIKRAEMKKKQLEKKAMLEKAKADALSKKEEEKAKASQVKEKIIQMQPEPVVPQKPNSEPNFSDENLSKAQRDQLKRLEKLKKMRQSAEEEIAGMEEASKENQHEKEPVRKSSTEEQIKEKPVEVTQGMMWKEASSPEETAESSTDEISNKIQSEKMLKDQAKAAYRKQLAETALKRDQAKVRLNDLKSQDNKFIVEQKKKVIKETRRIKQDLARIDFEQKKKWGDQAGKIYNHALKLYREGKYAAARAEFINVDRMSPGIRSAQWYILRIDSLLEKQEVREEKLKRKALQQAEENHKKEKKAAKVSKKENKKKIEPVVSQESAVQPTDQKPSVQGFLIQESAAHKEMPLENKLSAVKETVEEKPLTEAQKKKLEIKEEKKKAALEKKKIKDEQARLKIEEKQKAAQKLKEQKESKRAEKEKITAEAKKSKVQKEKVSIEKEKLAAEAKKVNDQKMQVEVSQKKQKEVIQRNQKIQVAKENLIKENAELRKSIYQTELSKNKELEALEIQKLREERLLLKEKEALAKKSKTVALKQAQIEKAEALRRKKEDERKKLIEEQKKKIIEEKQEQTRRKEEMARLRRETDQAYQDAVQLYKQNRVELSREKFKQLDQLLSSKELTEDYRKKMSQRADQIRSQLEIAAAKESEKNEKIAKKIMEKKINKEIDLESKSMKEEINASAATDDIEQLRKKVELEDQKLAKEKAEEAKRVQKAEEEKRIQKEAEEKAQVKAKIKAAETESVKEVKIKDTAYMKSDEDEMKKAEEEKRRELDLLVKRRQEDLRNERERLIQELNENVEHLYSKAVRLYDSGYYDEAKSLLSEVQDIRPGYKKATYYLNKIETSSRQPAVMSQKIQNTRNSSNQTVKKSKKNKTRQELISEALDSLEKGQ